MNILTSSRGMLALVTSAALIAAFFINPFVAGATNTSSILLTGASEQYLSAVDSSSLSVVGDITVEAWIKPNSMTDGVSQYIATKGTTNVDNAWRLMAHWNAATLKHNLVFTIDETGTNTVAVAYSYSDADLGSYIGTWVHVAGTWDSTSGTSAPKLYINGSEVGSYFVQGNDGGANAIADTDSPTYIGSSPNNPLYFDGKVDDVRIYNFERSPAEILGDYNKELLGNEAGLVAYWKLNNDSGVDATSNGNNLTEVNAPAYSGDVPFLDDTVPPSVNITNPTESSTVSGSIILTANASDDVAVAGVQFKVDGNNFSSEDTSTPYSVSLDTTLLMNGAHTVSAVARDTSNNTTTSATVNFTVNNVPPFVPVLKVRKTQNENLTSSNVVQNDDQLKLSLGANKTYIIDGIVFASSTNGQPDIKMNLSGVAGTSARLVYTDGANEEILGNGVTTSVVQLTAATKAVHIRGTVVTGNTDGDFQLKWAQNTSNANATSVLLGSYLRAEEI